MEKLINQEKKQKSPNSNIREKIVWGGGGKHGQSLRECRTMIRDLTPISSEGETRKAGLKRHLET